MKKTKHEIIATKYQEMFYLMCQWVSNLNEQKSISNYLINNGYRNIIIYGAGKIGICLCEELIKGGLNVEYIVDKNKQGNHMGIPIEKEFKTNTKVDLIIITAIFDSFKIIQELSIQDRVPIECLDNIIYKM